MYTKEELIKAAPKLGYSSVIVEAALKKYKKKKFFELEEALEIIKKFAERRLN